MQAQLLQARPEVVGVVVQLLDLAGATVSAILALCDVKIDKAQQSKIQGGCCRRRQLPMN